MAANAFTLFGKLQADTGAFERAMKSSDRLVNSVGKDIDATAGKAVKLGLTSATTARQFEKLNERLMTNKTLLHDAAKAFQDGDISARKMASTFSQVERATASVSSRVRDLKAQMADLGNVNFQLESFRQGLLSQQGGAQGGSVWSRLSGYQKTQLGFQANDIISGLAMGQSPFQILAQQGGQIVQIFQQTKTTQEGITKAATASAVAQKAFAAESDAAAKAIAQSHSGMTLLGASAVSLGAVLAAGTVAIAATYKITQDIQKAAERRLKNEMDIVAALNQQALIKQGFKDRLIGEQGERNFAAFVQDQNAFSARAAIASLTRQRDEFQKVIDTELAKRVKFAEAAPGILLDKDKDGNPKFLKVETFAKSSAEAVAKLNDQLSTLYGRLSDLNQSAPPSIARQIQQNTYQSAIAAYQNSLTVQAEAAIKKEKELAEQRKKLIDDSLDKVKELGKGYREALTGTISNYGAQNPFVKVFSDANLAMTRLRENTIGLGSDLRNSLMGMQQAANAANLLTQRINTRLEASNLSNLAQQFRQGFRTPETNASIQANVDRALRAIGGSSPFTSDTFNISRDGSLQRINDQFSDIQRRVRDQAIVANFSNLDPGKLRYDQNQAISGAFMREADRKASYEREATKLMQKQVELAEKISERLDTLYQKAQSGKLMELGIQIDDPNGRTRIGGTSGNVNARYK